LEVGRDHPVVIPRVNISDVEKPPFVDHEKPMGKNPWVFHIL